jgi:hypothetical protein
MLNTAPRKMDSGEVVMQHTDSSATELSDVVVSGSGDGRRRRPVKTAATG